MFDKLCKETSRVANRLIDKVVSDDPRLAFHSLRHNFKDFARDATVEKYILDQIMGHAGVATGDKYGVGARLKTLKRALDKISFDMLEGSGIKVAFGALDWTKALERRGGLLRAARMPDGSDVTIDAVAKLLRKAPSVSFACHEWEDADTAHVERHPILL